MFLKATAVLEQDRDPAAGQWDRLFATPGYAALLQREFARAFFVDRFTMAFMWYRARLAPDLTRDQDILWVIQQVQPERIGDLINVPTWMNRPPES